MCAVAAGGQVRLEAPGEVLRIVVSRPAWLVVSWPEHAAVQAARARSHTGSPRRGRGGGGRHMDRLPPAG
eukprot:12417052-Alexandrium_andersonii.AAC.1